MLPAEPRLEVRSRLPSRSSSRKNDNLDKPQLLFVHGGYCDSWCWEPYFLPWFAAQGYAAHALSLRGHGASGGAGSLFVAGLDDYAADVERVIADLEVEPVLIGHSMGAAVVERLMATRPLAAAVLMAPVPPTGLLLMAARLAAERPDYLMQMSQLNPTRLSVHVLETLRPYYFSNNVAPDLLVEAALHLGAESPRALMDLSMRLHWQLPERGGTKVLVVGAEGDRICSPDDVRATAQHHGVEAVLIPGLAHMMMLDRKWQLPAQAIANWLSRLP
jgi:non-heme chloroperoxidase